MQDASDRPLIGASQLGEDDPRRLLVAKVCAGFGRRVQYSVFECVLDAMREDRLVAALGQSIDPLSDRLHVYSLCPTCTAGIRFVGRPLGPDDPAVRTRFRIV
jgi:CRISPR-associated protein Cas2